MTLKYGFEDMLLIDTDIKGCPTHLPQNNNTSQWEFFCLTNFFSI